MIYYKGLPPICEPKNELCTMCVTGNKKIFNEIEEEKEKLKISKNHIDKYNQ